MSLDLDEENEGMNTGLHKTFTLQNHL